MKDKFSEQDFKNIAAQLRKPEGVHGTIVAKKMNEGNKAMNLHTIAVLDPQPNDTILEIGMGNGFFVKNMTSLDSTISYTGCDYSEEMVHLASDINSHLIDKGVAKFIQADIKELPFESNSFNKIVTINTFYFWEDYELVLKELKRVLKKEGELILSVRPKHNLEKFPVTKYGFSIKSKDEIINLLKVNGFAKIEITEIKEPQQEAFVGGHNERETLILSCKLD